MGINVTPLLPPANQIGILNNIIWPQPIPAYPDSSQNTYQNPPHFASGSPGAELNPGGSTGTG